MLFQTFKQHCKDKHPQTLRFQSKHEHEQDHRLHQNLLDHIHENQREPEKEDAGRSEPESSGD